MQTRSHTGFPSSSPAARLIACCCLIAISIASLSACGSKDEEKTTTAAPDPREAFEPTPGTYKYATKGFEKIDVLLGAKHDYPPTTRIRVKRTGCGYTERWNPIPERSTRFDYCVGADGSRRLVSLADFHEFIGYPVSLSYRCKGDPIPPLAGARKGARWTDRCTGGSTNLTVRGRVVGRETIDVGGVATDTVHLKISSRSTGKAAGDNVNDSWLAESNGLLVRRTVDGEARTKTTVGRVHSQERYRLSLQSGKPAVAAGTPDSG